MIKQDELLDRARELVEKKNKLSQKLAELKGQEDAIIKTLKGKGIKIEHLDKQIAEGDKKLKGLGIELSKRLSKAETMLDELNEVADED